MDHFSSSVQVDVIALDVDVIARSAKDVGLLLKPSKREIICADEEVADTPIFKHYIRVRPEDMTLLGASVLRGPAVDRTISAKTD